MLRLAALLIFLAAPALAESRLVFPVEGDTVAAGAEIARCGGPALHVHMQASRAILDADAEGLPMPFSDLDVMTPRRLHGDDAPLWRAGHVLRPA